MTGTGLQDSPPREWPVTDRPLGWFAVTDGQWLFRIWAPTAVEVLLHTWEGGEGEEGHEVRELRRAGEGTWEAVLPQDAGPYYAVEYFRPDAQGRLRSLGPLPDPWARAAAPGGRRAFRHRGGRGALPPAADRGPSPYRRPVDAVIYEVHVRDFSSGARDLFSEPGTFRSLEEEGLRIGGQPVGLDHLVDLGVTHVHLLPIFDFDGMADEGYDPADYNWGYNPRNYSVLKAAYSTRPQDPLRVIDDFRSMVVALHRKGIRVVVDMVYNHTYADLDSVLHANEPWYWHRTVVDADGKQHFANGSGCGNEVASERPMVRRMILDSLRWFRDELGVDGFRFDLMGLMDRETIRQIVKEFQGRDPGFLLYGEGWVGGDSALDPTLRSDKAGARDLPGMAFFSDDLRDAIKGSVFDATDPGFVQGKEGLEARLRAALAACAPHGQLSQDPALADWEPWARGPDQVVNYFAAHDNHTLWDKLTLSAPEASDQMKLAMMAMAFGLSLLAQGIAFIHAGEEFARTKGGDENSYRSPDAVNRLDWERRVTHSTLVDRVRGLIRIRQTYQVFRLGSAAELDQRLVFLGLDRPGLVAWLLDSQDLDAGVRMLAVLANAGDQEAPLALPPGIWEVLADGSGAGLEARGTVDGEACAVPPRTLWVLRLRD